MKIFINGIYENAVKVGDNKKNNNVQLKALAADSEQNKKERQQQQQQWLYGTTTACWHQHSKREKCGKN